MWDPAAIPAATVIPLRQAEHGVEVLMLRRDSELSFAGGMWVFPGGRLDPEDYPGGSVPKEPSEADLESAAKTAAQREAMEEAGVIVEPATLRRWSHWTPPPKADAKSGEAKALEDSLRSHRFTTAFFVGVAIGDTDAIRVDDGEIRAHKWATPAEMLGRQAAGEVTLAPPTFITLSQLQGPRNTAEVLLAAPKEPHEVEHFATRVGAAEGGWVALYHGDVAYEGGDTDAEGPRHRLTMAERWEYIRDVG